MYRDSVLKAGVQLGSFAMSYSYDENEIKVQMPFSGGNDLVVRITQDPSDYNLIVLVGSTKFNTVSKLDLEPYFLEHETWNGKEPLITPSKISTDHRCHHHEFLRIDIDGIGLVCLTMDLDSLSVRVFEPADCADLILIGHGQFNRSDFDPSVHTDDLVALA